MAQGPLQQIIKAAGIAVADPPAKGNEMPTQDAWTVSHRQLRDALMANVKAAGGPSNGGLDNHMWAAAVDRMGVVKAVCYCGSALGDQWPGSRVIAISKANTANALSLPKFALSTANLYAGAQPGG